MGLLRDTKDTESSVYYFLRRDIHENDKYPGTDFSDHWCAKLGADRLLWVRSGHDPVPRQYVLAGTGDLRIGRAGRALVPDHVSFCRSGRTDAHDEAVRIKKRESPYGEFPSYIKRNEKEKGEWTICVLQKCRAAAMIIST